jgi:hypothetical protein
MQFTKLVAGAGLALALASFTLAAFAQNSGTAGGTAVTPNTSTAPNETTGDAGTGAMQWRQSQHWHGGQ